MALKDLKSDLSKFRMPKKDPLESKERVTVNKNLNKTPLSSMVESAPKIPRSQTTTNKEGVNPKNMDNTSKFLGETTPTPSNNSEKFLGETTTKPLSLEERYLGETTPNSADNTSKFLGETTPTKFDNQSNFLGETNPIQFDNTSNFLGETNPIQFDNNENFLGLTTPTLSNRESKFLGETPPNSADNTSKFLGETTPNESDRSSKFLGETTPTPANNESRFLGETTPNPSDRSSKFLGETTPNSTDNTSKFLGETTQANVTFNPNHSDNGKTFKEVNYFQDIHATGFNSKFSGVESTKFTGVNSNNTAFDNTNSFYSNIDKSKFSTNKNYEKSYEDVGGINSGEDGFGIGKGHAKRKSPSFLDEQYSKFNLKEDSFNAGLGLFRQPFILRGIQRKKISKGEPQVWGLGGFNYDEGTIRGGIVTSTVRALIDVARIGSWFASIPGVLWGAKQFGMQRTNRFGKIWTPVGMLAAIGGQHIGLRPMRPGLVPLNDPTVKYGNILNGYEVAENAGFLAKKAAALLVGYDTLDLVYEKTKGINNKFKNDTDFNLTGGAWKSDKKGGFNSTYGINLSGPSNHTRYVNTFENPEKKKAADTADFKQKFNPTETLSAENLYPAQSEVQAGTATGDTVSDISQQLETRVNFGNPGRRVPSGGILIENRVDWTNTDPKNKEFLNRFDKVNASEVGAKEEVNDLIHLWFKAEGGSRVQFRGTVAGITDTFSPSWDSVKYNGRADQAYQYKTFERSLSFTFKVYATSRIEMMPIYKKLSYLASMTMPQYHGSAGYNGTLLKFRLGSLFQNHLAFIESLSYSMSDETPWDIALDNTVGELPMGIDVSIGLKILPKTGTQVPKLGSKNYDTIF